MSGVNDAKLAWLADIVDNFGDALDNKDMAELEEVYDSLVEWRVEHYG